MTGLKAVVLNRENTPAGQQAYLLLVEPNGDEHLVRCLCRHLGQVEIGENADSQLLPYLNERYGAETVCMVCRYATMMP